LNLLDFEVTDQPIDTESLKSALTGSAAGACVCFEGWVRNHNEGREVLALEYEAHAPLATREGEVILGEARRRFALLSAAGRHRVGHLEIGECAVWVGVTAPHRGAGFEACRYIIDELKQRLPIWKKEHYRDGDSSWINCVTGSADAASTGESEV